MNSLTAAIAQTCQVHLTSEKWLLAPSRRVGHQWLEIVARSGQAVLNVRVKTLRALALEVAGPMLAHRGLALATARPCALLLHRVLCDLRFRLQYLSSLEPDAALAETVLASIDALRLAGLDATQLNQDYFEVSDKGRDLRVILSAYLKRLEREKMVDYAHVLVMAAQRLRKDPRCVGNQTFVLVPDDLHFAGLETTLLAEIPRECRIALPVDTPVVPTGQAHADLQLFSESSKSASAHEARSAKIRIVHAVGEVNEVRYVLRDCVARGIPLDEVELLHTDAQTYVPLIYETLAALEGDGDENLGSDALATRQSTLDTSGSRPNELGLPVTFNEGIPCDHARPGRALFNWLQWVHDDFSQTRLIRMLEEGLLALPDGSDPRTSFTRLAQMLRGVVIRFGRGRYLPKLDERIAALDQRSGQVAVEDEVLPSAARLQQEVEELKLLRGLVKRLLTVSPGENAPSQQVLAQAQQFVENTARGVNPLDHFAAQRLVAELADMTHWLERGEVDMDVWQWIESLPKKTRVLGSGPRPGCLHVDSVDTGGHSGRQHTFVVGLEDSRFPGTGGQDPLLLDGERSRLSSHLTTAADRLGRRIDNFARLLARVHGHLTLSFSCRGLDDDRDMFPSSLLLPTFRQLSGRNDAEQNSLIDALPPPESFAPGEPAGCLDTREWWLWRLTGPRPVEDAAARVLERFDHLGHGQAAVTQRASSSFTTFDGHVHDAGKALDPTSPRGRVVSARMLETLGTCPRRFFFRYALDIEPPEDVSTDPQRWLDGRASGALLHTLFEQFMHDLVNKQQTPNFDRDHERLEELLKQQVARYQDLFPPPSDSTFQWQCDELRQTAHTFLRAEEDFCKSQAAKPVFLEVSIGMPPDEHGTLLDTRKPVPVTLSDGGVVRARGRVDRIDLIGQGTVYTYGIWDYKTGSDWGFERKDPFMQGRKVQPFLYLTIAGHRLRERVSDDVQIQYFGFFFPGVRTYGNRIPWRPDELSEGPQILQMLCDTLANGVFIATNDVRDCTFCDYRSICGDVEVLTQQSQKKLENEQNEILEPFRSLRTTEM